MIIEFLKYLLWATIQQAIVLLPILYFVPHNLDKTIYSVIVFSFVFHAGNLKLTLFCLALAISFYPLFFYSDIKIIMSIVIVLTHAIAGTILKRNDLDMRVWRF